MAVIYKTPFETNDYFVDFSKQLSSGETLVSFSVTAFNETAQSDATAEIIGPTAPSISGTQIVFWYQGGILNNLYVISVQATTSQGRGLEGDVNLIVINQAQIAEPPQQQNLQPSPVDLTTLQNVKDWLKLSVTTDDQILQACITAASLYILQKTGTGDQNGDLQQSPLASVCYFSEWYDGSGTTRLFLRNRPIVSIVGITINGFAVPLSTGFAVAGYVVDGSAKSISLRQGLLGWGGSWGLTAWQAGSYRSFGRGPRFWQGNQNINVQYNAGFNTTPFDLELAVKRIVAMNYKRRDWVGELSRSMGLGAGSMRFSSWIMDPQDEDIILAYTRTLG